MKKTIAAKSAPRDVFLYLFTIITLYISVWRFIDLLFEYINFKFPDNVYVGYYGNSFYDMRISMASLLVVFPVYVLLTWYLRKDIIKHPEKQEMKVRKWLLNLTLFLAAITIIVDLTTLVNYFLRGEWALRFILKVAVVLAVAGAVFAYYIWDLKRKTLPNSKPSKLIAVAAGTVVLLSIIAGFFIVGSPIKQRNIRFDEQRISNLQTLQNEIISYWQRKNQLPGTLDNLKNDISGFIPPRDPESDIIYEYNKVDSLNFELCSVFKLPAPQKNEQAYNSRPYALFEGQFVENWKHDAGRFCFKRTIDADLYKFQPLPPPAPKFD